MIVGPRSQHAHELAIMTQNVFLTHNINIPVSTGGMKLALDTKAILCVPIPSYCFIAVNNIGVLYISLAEFFFYLVFIYRSSD